MTQTALDPRPLNDLSPRLGLDGNTVGDPERYELLEMETPEDIEAGRALVSQVMSEEFKRLESKFTAFEAECVKMIDEMGKSCRDQRNKAGINFAETYQLCERRAHNEILLITDEEGKPIKGALDGHAKLRMSLGLAMSAINTAVPALIEYVLGGGKSINKITSRGKDDESPDREEMIGVLLDHQHEQGSYEAVLKQCIAQAAGYPAGVMRQRWNQKLGTCLDPKTGELAEEVRFEGEQYECWPLPRAFFSDPNKKLDQQRFIIWAGERTIPEILAEERVIVPDGAMYWDPVTGSVIPERLNVHSGRFFNLESYKAKADGEGMQRKFSDRYSRFTTWAYVDDRKVDRRTDNAGSLIGEIEAEGYIDFSPMVMNGKLDAELLNHLLLRPIPGIEAMTKGELCRRLAGAFWRMTVTTDGKLIELRILEEKPAEFSAHVETYIPGEGIYGKGIPQLGEKLMRVIDNLVNDQEWQELRRADPVWLANISAMVAGATGKVMTAQDVRRAVNGRGEVITTNGIVDDNVLRMLAPDANPGWVDNLMLLIGQYQEVTLVNEALRGMQTGGTATESENAQAQSSVRIIDVAKRMAESFAVRPDRRALTHFGAYLQGRFEDYLFRVAGAAGLKAYYMLPGPTGLADQVRITHNGIANRNREVRTAQFAALAERYLALGMLDPEKAFLHEAGMLDVADAEGLIAAATFAKDPKKEVRVFAQGRFIEPSPMEDPMAHYLTHVQQIIAINRAALMELDPELLGLVLMSQPKIEPVPPGLEKFYFDPEILLPPLLEHAKATERMIQAAIAAQEAAEQQAAAQAMEVDAQRTDGGPKKPGQGASNPGTQTTQQSQRGAVARQGAQPPLKGMIAA